MLYISSISIHFDPVLFPFLSICILFGTVLSISILLIAFSPFHVFPPFISSVSVHFVLFWSVLDHFWSVISVLFGLFYVLLFLYCILVLFGFSHPLLVCFCPFCSILVHFGYFLVFRYTLHCKCLISSNSVGTSMALVQLVHIICPCLYKRRSISVVDN